MDLIDVIRIAARRWYVVGAILMTGVVAALLLASSVAPAYRVETQSILISGQVPSSQSGVDEPGNPYLAFSGSLFTTLSAVTRTVDGQEFRERLDADETERDYEFTTSQEAPVIITKTTAATPEEALTLADKVQQALSETLVVLQSEENVPKEQQIIMRVLTTSKPQEEVGDRNRVLFGVLGLSFAASIGGAVLVESIAQARKRSLDEIEGIDDANEAEEVEVDDDVTKAHEPNAVIADPPPDTAPKSPAAFPAKVSGSRSTT